MPPIDYDPQAWEKHCEIADLYGAYEQEGWAPYRMRNAGALWTAVAETGSINVLDTGCFIGVYSQTLAIADLSYTGLDITPKFIAEAKRLRPELKFVVGDVRSMPFPDRKFDLVFSFGTLIHLDSVSEALHELWRVANKCLLVEATTHHGREDIMEIPNDDPRFVHRAYSRMYLNKQLAAATGTPTLPRSAVGTYRGLQSTLWRVDKPSA